MNGFRITGYPAAATPPAIIILSNGPNNDQPLIPWSESQFFNTLFAFWSQAKQTRDLNTFRPSIAQAACANNYCVINQSAFANSLTLCPPKILPKIPIYTRFIYMFGEQDESGQQLA